MPNPVSHEVNPSFCVKPVDAQRDLRRDFRDFVPEFWRQIFIVIQFQDPIAFYLQIIQSPIELVGLVFERMDKNLGAEFFRDLERITVPLESITTIIWETTPSALFRQRSTISAAPLVRTMRDMDFMLYGFLAKTTIEWENGKNLP